MFVYLFISLVQLVYCQDIISTIAGTGASSYSGDGGAATSATFASPYGIAVDSSGIQIQNINHS